jgi:hypothetical protein
MKTVFARSLGATLALAMPASAKLIGTNYYEPAVMLEMCKSDVARGEAGFCTGYVIATWKEMAGAGQVCMPSVTEYEEMVRVVIDRLEYVLKLGKDTRTIHAGIETATALRGAWPCKK